MRSVRWEIESDCNLRCKHCFIGKLQSERKLSLGDKNLICDELIRHNVSSVALTTKEPLLNNDNIDIIKKLSNANIQVLLVTNGTLIDYQYANIIVDSGLNGIAISLEGVSSKSNDEIRGSGSFERAIKGLSLINDAMILLEKSISISIQMTLNKYNILEVEKILDFFDSYHINSLSIGTISNSGNAEDNQHIILSHNQYFEACLQLAKLYKDKDIKTFVLEFKSLSPWEAILINLITGSNICYYIPNCSAKEGTYSLTTDAMLIPCISLKSGEDFSNYNLLMKNRRFEWEEIANKFLGNTKELYVKGKVCLDCIFKKNCTPCPAALEKYGINSDIFTKCNNALHEIKKIISRIIKNNDLDKLKLNPGIYEYKEGSLEIKRVYSNGITIEDHIFIENEVATLILYERWDKLKKHYVSNKDLEKFLFNLITKDLLYIVGENSYETDF